VDILTELTTEPPKVLRYFAWLLLASAACFQFALCCAPPGYLVAAVTVDDTFLYLQIARNWADLGFPTFDGENATSGFQPLWNGVLVVLATAISDRETLLRASCFLTALLNLLTAPLVLRLGKRLASPSAAYLAMAGWCLYLFCPRSPNGMESSLHGVVFALAALVALRVWKEFETTSSRVWLLLGGLLALNGLCRLDSGIVSALVAVLFGWRFIKHRNWSALVAFCIFPMLCMALYFGASFAYFGSLTPVSGKVKMYWAHTAPDYTLVNAFAATITGTIRSFCHSLMYVTGGGEAYSYPWLPILLLLLAWALFCSRRAGKLDSRLIVGYGLLLIQTFVIHFTLQHLGKSYWYYQPLRVWSCLVVGQIAWWIIPGVPPLAMQGLKAALVLFACGFGISRGISLYSVGYDGQPYETMNAEARALDMAVWIQQTAEIPADARLGSWNAGILGYFSSPKQVFNLDGLVQSNDYLRRVIRPRAWKDYLRRERIDYLVDTNYQDSTQTYRQQWDRERMFRGLVPFDQTRVVKQMGPLYLLDIRPWLATPDEPTSQP
jgi:hypothetical protein